MMATQASSSVSASASLASDSESDSGSDSGLAYRLRSRRVPKVVMPQNPENRKLYKQYLRACANPIGMKKKTGLKRPLQVLHGPIQSFTREQTLNYITKFSDLACKALEYFNSIEHTGFKLSEVTFAGMGTDMPTIFHINFLAEWGGDSELFYAELKDVSPEYGVDDIYVKGCCILKPIDSRNPLGMGCTICEEGVIHPGPRDGFRIVQGDLFKDSEFWDYQDTKYKPCNKRLTATHMDLYKACAKKALAHFNSNQGSDFIFLEVTVGCHQFYHYRRTAHLNFLAKSSNSSHPELFYAEVYPPVFAFEYVDSWDESKEPFIEVKSCSLLKKTHSENPFGRVCGLCFKDVLHPGPKDGYDVVAGDDDFEGSDFMGIGSGIF